MLHRRTQPRPEATACHQLAIVGAAVVVAAYGSTCCHVALSHDDRGDEERVVVMLLVGREDEVVEHLAARDGAVVAHDGVYEAGTVLEVRVVSQDELDCRARIEYATSISYDTIDENYILSYL